ncbi:Uma2 family endonuclease [Leptolyngbya sp. AN03gr2]|uniref:Uma2 family endonuclease n=1 Tax=unclassified Leptolyngbya TaxID=2650499 RepID=UPI003D3161BD
MTQTKTRFTSIEEFLAYDDGTNTRYELVNGVLVDMGAESTTNTIVAGFLFATFLQLGIPAYRIGFKQWIAVSSKAVTARDPDLIVHSEGSFASIDGLPQALIAADASAPLIVIEIVSPGNPGSENYNRDYVEKPNEYAARGIPEFWRIDPERSIVTVLKLENGTYQAKDFRGSELIVSPTFPTLQLTAEQILRAGR